MRRDEFGVFELGYFAQRHNANLEVMNETRVLPGRKKMSGVLVHSFFEDKPVELSSLFFERANFFHECSPYHLCLLG